MWNNLMKNVYMLQINQQRKWTEPNKMEKQGQQEIISCK